MFGFTEAAEGVSFGEMAEHQKAVAEAIRRDPAVASTFASIGASGPNVSVNTGRVFVGLKPRSERDASADDVIARLRPALATIPGIRVFLQNPPPIRIGGQLTKSQYQLALQGLDTDALYRGADALLERLRKLPELRDVTSDLQLKNPTLHVEIERDRAAALGVSAGQIEDALYSAYASRQVSTIYAPDDQYDVIVELEPEWRENPQSLGLLRIRSSHGRPRAARVGRADRADRRADLGEPPGAAPGGDALVRPGPGGRARRTRSPPWSARRATPSRRPSSRASRVPPRRSRPPRRGSGSSSRSRSS